VRKLGPRVGDRESKRKRSCCSVTLKENTRQKGESRKRGVVNWGERDRKTRRKREVGKGRSGGVRRPQ
jgi:hypothetical protein